MPCAAVVLAEGTSRGCAVRFALCKRSVICSSAMLHGIILRLFAYARAAQCVRALKSFHPIRPHAPGAPQGSPKVTSKGFVGLKVVTACTSSLEVIHCRTCATVTQRLHC